MVQIAKPRVNPPVISPLHTVPFPWVPRGELRPVRPAPRHESLNNPRGQGGQHHRETTVSQKMKSPKRTVPIPNPTRDDIR